MNALALIQRLRQHQVWVNRRLLAAARPLTAEQLHQPFRIGQGTLWKTLVHLYATELIWLEAMQGNPHPPAPADVRVDSLAALEADWQALEQRWQAVVATLTEADLTLPVHKASTASGPGRPLATPLADVLLHVATHAQYTTAQARNILRHLGVAPLPDVMLITLSREEAAARPPEAP